MAGRNSAPVIAASAAGATAAAIGAVAWPRVAASPAASDAAASNLVIASVGVLTAVLLISSIDTSLVQTLSERWPSYIYGPKDRGRGPVTVYRLVAFGLALDFVALLLGVAGFSAIPGAALASATCVVAVVILVSFLLDQAVIVDPHEFAQRAVEQMRLHRPVGGRDDSHHQELYLRDLDRVLGLVRWFAQHDRPKEARSVFARAMEELRDCSGDRRIAGRRTGRWDFQDGANLWYAWLPGPATSLFDQLSPTLGTSSDYWLEIRAADWISRTLASVAIAHDVPDRSGWDSWLSLQRLWIDELMGLADAAARDRAAHKLVVAVARPIIHENVGPRSLRDELIVRAVADVARAYGQSESDASTWRFAVRDVLINSRPKQFSPVVSIGDDFAASVACALVIERALSGGDREAVHRWVARFALFAERLESDCRGQDLDEAAGKLGVLNPASLLGTRSKRPGGQSRTELPGLAGCLLLLDHISAALSAAWTAEGEAFDAANARVRAFVSSLPAWRLRSEADPGLKQIEWLQASGPK